MNAKKLAKYLIISSAVLSLGACNSLSSMTQSLGGKFDSWSVVPLETDEMRVAKAEKAITQETRFSAQPDGPLGAFGLNLGTYLLDAGAAPDTRLDRLERSVIALQKDLKIMAPVVQNLNGQVYGNALDRTAPHKPMTERLTPQAVEHAIDADAPPVKLSIAQNAPSQTKIMFDRVEQTLNAQNDADMATPSLQPLKAAQTAHTIHIPTITDVRTGVHKGIMRIVFDVSTDTPYTVDLDNDERILVVEFPRAGWNAAALNREFSNNTLLKGYRVDSAGAQNEGKIFVLQLKKTSRIQKKTLIPAASGAGKRIVIDLKA